MSHQLFDYRNRAVEIALAASLVCIGSAHASLVTVTMAGHLTSVPSQVASEFTANETFTLNYTCNIMHGNAGSASNAIYYYQSYHLNVGSGAFTLSAPAGGVFANAVSIDNSAYFDAYVVDATDGLLCSPSASIAPYTLVRAFTQFSYAPSQFSGPALLPGAPFTGANGLSLQPRPDPLSLDGGIFVEGVIGTVTDDQQVPAPEPSTIALLVPALAFVARLRRPVNRSNM